MTIRQYLTASQYSSLLNRGWYYDFVNNCEILERCGFKFNLSKLNMYLYDRYFYERGRQQFFDNERYSPSRMILDYEADTEIDDSRKYKKNLVDMISTMTKMEI